MSSFIKYKRNSSIDILEERSKSRLSCETNNEENEGLHDHIVEPYLESILRPLNIIQNIFFCAKYSIRGHVIKPITWLYSAVSFIFYFLIMVYIYCTFFLTHNRSGVEVFEYFFTNVFRFVLFSIGGLVNVFVNIKQKYNNVLYVLKIQNVHRILKLNGSCFKRSIISNWACVLAINCCHISWTFIYYFAFNDVDFLTFLTGYMCIRFDVNAIYATRCLRLMTESLKVWTSDLHKLYICDPQNSYSNTMFRCYIDITEIARIVEKTFQHMIFFYLVHTCSNSLLDIWVRVEMRPTVPNKDLQYTLLTCSSLTWVVKNLLIITFLCVESEKYYSAIKEIESTCSQMITSEKSTANQRRFCKNILRVQKASFTKLSVCGLFAVDASLPLHVIAFITTHTIVLLQFVFL